MAYMCNRHRPPVEMKISLVQVPKEEDGQVVYHEERHVFCPRCHQTQRSARP